MQHGAWDKPCMLGFRLRNFLYTSSLYVHPSLSLPLPPSPLYRSGHTTTRTSSWHWCHPRIDRRLISTSARWTGRPTSSATVSDSNSTSCTRTSQTSPRLDRTSRGGLGVCIRAERFWCYVACQVSLINTHPWGLHTYIRRDFVMKLCTMYSSLPSWALVSLIDPHPLHLSPCHYCHVIALFSPLPLSPPSILSCVGYGTWGSRSTSLCSS